MKSLFAIFFVLLVPVFLSAQIKLIPFDSIPVTADNQNLTNAWTGGFNCPQFSQVDLNNDGKKDLVTFERNFYGSVKTFINKGNDGEVIYEYAPQYRLYFPQMRNWMLMRDYNCDGKNDIFTGVPAGIAVYRNDSDASGLKFTQVTSLLIGEGFNGPAPLYVSPPDIPSIEDVDGDGDLDILSFNIVGSTVEYHKNLSMELYGDCSELEFELKNACWGYFIEDANTNEVTLSDTCDINVPDPEKFERHPGSTLLAIDLSGNGVKDLLIGDINFPNLIKLNNGGTTTAASMISLENDFPGNSEPVNLIMFPAPFFMDVDNDGLKDMIVAPNNPNTSENFNNTWFYKNEGTETLPEFNFVKSDFLFDQMIDVGERSYPVFFDENSDGLQDIVVGNFGYFESAGNYNSRLMLIRNIGTAASPEFEIIDDDYSNLGQLGFNGIYPSFGDMDGDGDQDMISGDEDGSLHYFRNDGGAGNPAIFTLAEAFYFDIDVGQSAKPQVVDVNRDELMDLLVGERSGTVNYFENTGTVQEAIFSINPTVEEFGGVDVMPECCTGFSAPFFSTDSLGSSILYVGSEQGKLYLFDDIDGNLEGEFNPVDSLYLHAINLSIHGADINNDGYLEFVTGEFPGGIGLLKKGEPPSLSIDENGKIIDLVNVYPNPANQFLIIKSKKPEYRVENVSIFNLTGQAMLVYPVEGNDQQIFVDVSDFPKGIYILKIQIAGSSISGKIIVE